MSGYKLHILFYWILSSIIVLYLSELGWFHLTTESTLVCLLIGTLYSILPDIDIPSSVLRRMIEKTLLLTCIFSMGAYLIVYRDILIYSSIAFAAFLYMLWNQKHRGFFHSLSAAFILSLPLLYLDPYYMAFGLFGFATHLTLDGKLLSLI